MVDITPADDPAGLSYEQAEAILQRLGGVRSAPAPDPLAASHPVDAPATGRPAGHLELVPPLTAEALHGLVEAVPVALVVVDATGRIVLVNRQAEWLFGYARDELHGFPIETLLPDRVRDRHVGQRNGYFAAPHVRPMGKGRELVGRRKDGHEVPVEISLSPLRTEAGLLVVSSVRDVTERRKAEAQLRKMEARYRTLVEGIPAVTFMAAMDDTDERELYVSPQIEELLGFSQKEWLENPILWYTQLHPDDRTRWHQEFARTCATGERFRSVYRFVARDGRVVWVHGEAQMVKDTDGQPLFLQGVAFDVTGIKEAEEGLKALNATLEDRVAERTAVAEERATELTRSEAALRVSEERYRLMVDGVRDYAIFLLDPDGRVATWNAGAERIKGYTAAEIVGRHFSAFYPPEVNPKATTARGLRTATAEGRFEEEGWRVRKDGSRFWAQVLITALRDPAGRVHGFVKLTRDLTERKKAEEGLARVREEKIRAEAANRAKSAFLSRMSHELRTPLNAILGFSQLMEMNPLSDDQRESVGQIKRGGKHLLGLINEVLDITRIEAGRAELSAEPIRVAGAVREAVGLVQSLALAAAIQIHVEPIAAERYYVVADAQRLKQVLLNLLSNAVKYNRERGAVRLSCTEVGADRLRLTVGDTGPGIPPDKIGRLFIPFDRLGAESTDVEGLGLGLALSKTLVEMMGGTLTATSVVGEGSRFSVELARVAPPDDAPEPKSGERRRPVSAEPALRTVLYIEDNLDNVRLVQRMLAYRPGVQLLTATQGLPGTEMARQHRPDLILLDVHLPDLDGEQVLRRIRADPETRSIPVIVLSADATPQQIENLRAAGAGDYLTKPIDVPQFFRVVDNVLNIGTPDHDRVLPH